MPVVMLARYKLPETTLQKPRMHTDSTVTYLVVETPVSGIIIHYPSVKTNGFKWFERLPNHPYITAQVLLIHKNHNAKTKPLGFFTFTFFCQKVFFLIRTKIPTH